MSFEIKKENSRSNPGLLGRAVLIRSDGDSSLTFNSSNPMIEEFDDSESENSIFDFIEDLHSLNDGLEMPSRLFTLLSEKAGILSGALLLIDESCNFFVHSGSIGIDKTTIHRLKIPRDFIENLTSGAEEHILLENDSLSSFKPYLSMRLFDSAEEIIIFTLSAENKVLAVIMILEYDGAEKLIIDILKKMSTPVTEILVGSKFLKINRNYSTSIPTKEELLTEIEMRVEETLSRNDKLALIVLDLSNIMDFLSEQSPALDTYRAKNDITAILNNMVEGLGDVKFVDPMKLLIIISSKTSLNNVMLLNQLRLSLQSFFQHRDNFPQLFAGIKRIPDDGMDPSILLEELL